MPFAPLLLAALVAASPSPVPGASVHPPSAYAAFVAGAKRQSGLFDVLTKDDQLYFDLGAANLDTTYVIEGGIARGVGNAFTGRALDALPVQFVRQGNRIFWEVPNANYVAPADATGRLDLDQSIVADSVIAETPIVAEDQQSKRVIIAVTPLLGDFEHVLEVLNPRPPVNGGLVVLGSASGYALSPATTYALEAKTFPTNVDVLVNLGLVAPPNAPPSIADPRGLSIVMHYSIIALPAGSGYQPRLADDRVGYFVDTLKNLSDQRSPTPYVRYIERWDMRKRPIVFYLTNEIPAQYRDSVRKALLAWNGAFARIGMPGAIEVRDQPADPSWDPDDARYSTVRWITSDTPGFGAYTGVYTDPYTGQIYRAEIVIDGEYLRTVRNGYRNDVAPAVTESDDSYQLASAQQANFAMVAARALGDRLDADRFVRDFVEAAVMHEAGHAFGLRHNFEASAYYSLAQINDAAFTLRYGLSASVMDYLPVNIAPPHVRQGAYFQLHLGPYDYWAIEYGYGADPRAIAAESGRPAYRYGTDENGTTLSPDPRIAPFDLSSDPLGWANEQFGMTRAVLARLDARYARSRRSYYDERLAFLAVLRDQLRTASLAARYVGGIYTSRTHRGQPGARSPFTPVPRATARRAFGILARNVFTPDAFTFSPQLMRDLGPDYFNGWGLSAPARTDLPATGLSDAVQGTVLNQLFSTINVARIYDVESTAPRGTAMSLADLFEWTRAAAFAEFPAHPNAASAAHRELQRQYVDMLISYSSAASLLVQGLGVPREAQAIARYELEQVRRTVRAALNDSSLDITTRAHLEDLESRCDRALHGVNIIQP